VIDAAQGRMALDSAKQWDDLLQLSGLVLTKLDGSAKGGSVVAVWRELGVPVKLVGVGEGIEDLRDFEAESFVDGLLGIGAAGGKKEDESKKLEKRLIELRKARDERAKASQASAPKNSGPGLQMPNGMPGMGGLPDMTLMEEKDDSPVRVITPVGRKTPARRKGASKKLLEFFVNDVESQAISSTFHLGDQVTQGLFTFNLFLQVFAFNEISQLGVTMGISSSVQLQKAVMNSLFHGQGLLHGLQSRVPFEFFRFLDVIEDHATSTLVLVLNQFHSVLTLLFRILSVLFGKASQSHIITVKIGSHGHVGITGIELHVDLLVDFSLGFLMEVKSDSGRHFSFFVSFLRYQEIKRFFKL